MSAWNNFKTSSYFEPVLVLALLLIVIIVALLAS